MSLDIILSIQIESQYRTISYSSNKSCCFTVPVSAVVTVVAPAVTSLSQRQLEEPES